MLEQAAKNACVWLRIRRLNRFLASAERARQVQHEVLMTKLRRHADSDFGRDHHFREIQTVSDFRRRVPVTDYAYHQSYIERVKQGEIGALFHPKTKVLMLALTSGTTNACKYVPITQEFFAEYRNGWNLWAANLVRQHRDLVWKKTVKLGSNWRQGSTEGGLPYGSISGLVAETAPRVARSMFAIPGAVYSINDSALKHYTALRLSVANEHVGMIGTANPSTLLEFARMADEHRDALIRDIFDGTLRQESELPAAVRSALHRVIHRRNPSRARELEQIVARTGKLYPRDYWPQLSVIAVWMGGSVGVYLPRLETYYGSPAMRDHGLNASEGRMTMPLRDQTSEGIIEFMHHFFEFIPVGEHDSANPIVLEPHELEIDEDYYILLTTSAGLYRYDIHDVVRCVGFEGQAPLLTFLNKGAHFSNITGEKLSEFQVVSAVRHSFTELKLEVPEFTVAPVMDDRPGYLLLIEQDLDETQNSQLAQRIDEHLHQLNFEYAEKRRSGRLTPLAVRNVPMGTWRRMRARRTAARGNFEEYKHPCLVGDLQFVERLTASESISPQGTEQHTSK